MATTATVPAHTRRLPLVVLVAVNAVSLVGNMLTVVALPWFVLETTGSAAQAGLTGFFILLPGFLAGVFGGAVVDRLGFKRASVLSDVLNGVGIACIPLLYQTGGLAFWQLLLLVFLSNLLDVPGLTARRSLLPDLAALAGTRLERANAVYEANDSLALLLGPPLAGVLVVWLGAANVLWLDAATFAVSAAAIAVAVPQTKTQKVETTESYLSEVVAGLRFIWRDRVLLALAAGLCASNLLGNPLFVVVAPVYARETWGSAAGLGLMLGAFGAGGLAGTLAYGAVGHRLSRRVLWLTRFLVFPLVYWILPAGLSLPVIVGLYATIGFVGGPLNPLSVTVRHERIPAELRGRVFATFSALALAASPVGVVAAGFLIERWGFTPTVLALAAGAQLAGVGMLFVPALRQLDGTGRRASTAVAEPTG